MPIISSMRAREGFDPAQITPRTVIRHELTPQMIEAGVNVLLENTPAVNSGEMSAQEFIAQVFGAVRCEQLRKHTNSSELHKSDPQSQ